MSEDAFEVGQGQLPEGSSNILLAGGCLDVRIDSACADLLANAPPDEQRILLVTVARSPEARVETVRSFLPAAPRDIAIVSADPDVSSRELGGQQATGEYTVWSGGSPGDLTSLGIALIDRLSTWSDDAPVSFCLHSITPLLQYNTLDQVFHFLRILTERVEGAGAVAHYHIDSGAHDEQTMQRLRPLFDASLGAGESEDHANGSKDRP